MIYFKIPGITFGLLAMLKPLRAVLLLALCVLTCSCQDDDTIVQSLLDLSGAPLIYDDSQESKFLSVVAVSIQVWT